MVSEVAHRAGYDLSSWQGIAKLLADARTKLKGSEYQSFYDGVTAYSRSRGTDTARLAEIEKTLATWTSGSASPIPKESPKPQSRPEPVSETKFSDIPAPDDGDADAVVAAALKEQASAPVKMEDEALPTKESDTPVPKPVTVPEHVDEPVVKEHLVTLGEARERILEIKHEVHELVGNPVVLVGELGAIGKSYMQSLLKATRATMGGSGGAIMPAMRELESVYEKLRVAALSDTGPEEEPVAAEVPEHETEEEAQPEAVVSEGKEDAIEEEDTTTQEDLETERTEQEASPSRAEVEREPVREQEAVHEETDEVVPHEEAPVERVVPEVRRVARPRPQFHKPLTDTNIATGPSASDEHDEELTTLRARLNALEHKLDDAETKSREVPKVPEKDISHNRAPTVEKTESPTPFDESSLLKTPAKPAAVPPKSAPEPLHTLPTFTVVKKDRELEYQSEEVTEGLRSLLMSWDIFRGGILSGKSRGAEHPLYLTIRELTMSDVLAGKFSGAKTHIVISINDYVNAWRFEQGIEYNPLETFEHYIRRVIHRILGRTKEMM